MKTRQNNKINKKNIRYFNKIEVINDTHIIKSYIGDNKYFKNKFVDEIIWMLKAQKLISENVPKIVDYSLDIDNLWMKYEIVNEKSVHDIFLDSKSKFDSLFWNEFALASKNLFNSLKQIKPLVFIKEEWQKEVYNFSVKRQNESIKKLSLDPKFRTFFKNEDIFINNLRYPSLRKIQEYLENKIIELDSNEEKNDNDIFYILSNPEKDRICFTHLDLVFGNIFFNKKNKNIKIIDPRGSYNSNHDFGDIYYDYAKYFQSIYGLYDFIAEDKFEIDINEKESNITYKIEKPKNYNLIKQAFEPFFKEIDINVIKLIEAFQFLTMVPAHMDNYKRQIIELCIGIQHIYEVIGSELWR